MIFYFQLQFKLICRKLTAFGVPPLIAFLSLPLIFFLASNYLFDSHKVANFIYAGIALGILFSFYNHRKRTFLKGHFSKKNFIQIVIIERVIIALPFISFLIFKKEFLIGALIFLASIFSSLVDYNNRISIYLPTPFSKKPFEFCVGFRKTFYLFPFCYALSYISIEVGNLNLGLFALICLFFITTTYYSKSEPEIYIWVHKYSPKNFIRLKIRQAIVNFILLSIPISITLIFGFPKQIATYLLLLVILSLALSIRVLMKYSVGNQINLAQGFTFYISVVVFPFLFILLPFYYKQAIQKLSNIL